MKNVSCFPQEQYWWCHYAMWSMSMSSCHHSAEPSFATTIRTSKMQPAPWVPTTLCSMRRTWLRGWTRVQTKTSIIMAGWHCLDLTLWTVHRLPPTRLLNERLYLFNLAFRNVTVLFIAWLIVWLLQLI